MQKSTALSLSGTGLALAIAGVVLAQDPPPPPPADDGIVIRCTRALQDCVVTGVNGSGPVPGAPGRPSSVKDLKRFGFGIAPDADVPTDHPAPVAGTGTVLHGTHCWVQLPSGQWQMYHCG